MRTVLIWILGTFLPWLLLILAFHLVRKEIDRVLGSGCLPLCEAPDGDRRLLCQHRLKAPLLLESPKGIV